MSYGKLGRFTCELDLGIPNARAYLQGAIAIARELNFGWVLVICQLLLAAISSEEGNCDKARSLLTESMALFQTEGNKQFMNITPSRLADVARAKGDHEIAVELYGEALGKWQDLDNPGATARCLECLAFVAIGNLPLRLRQTRKSP